MNEPSIDQAPQAEGCLFEFAPGTAAPNELQIVLSARKAYTMRADYPRDTLYVADQRNGYYFHAPKRVLDAIAGFVERRGYRRVLLLGSSKSGFAALMLAGLLALRRPDLAVRALSLNPITQLFPDDRSIPYWSYRVIQRRAMRDARLARKLRAVGDLSHLAYLPNFHAIITYPALNPDDVRQARRMKGANFRLIPVDSPIHGTIIFFNWQGASERAILRRLEWMFDQGDAEGDRDLASTRPADLSAVAKAIAAARLPTFQQLIDEAFAAEPRSGGLLARAGQAGALRGVRAVQRARALAAASGWFMGDGIARLRNRDRSLSAPLPPKKPRRPAGAAPGLRSDRPSRG